MKAKQYFQSEVHPRVQNLEHARFLKVIGYSPVPFAWAKRSGKVYEAMFVAMELVVNGELFDYMNSYPFREQIAHFYFKQLIEGVELMHGEGLVHRDLKMENLLLDENFNMKIADFGFSCP